MFAAGECATPEPNLIATDLHPEQQVDFGSSTAPKIAAQASSGLLDRDVQTLELSNSAAVAAIGIPFPAPNTLNARRPVATVSPCPSALPVPASLKLAIGTHSRAATTPMSAASGASRGAATLKWSNDGQPLSSTLSADSFERAPQATPTAVQQTHRFVSPAPAPGLFGVSESVDEFSITPSSDPWNQQPSVAPAMGGDASSTWAPQPIGMPPFVPLTMSRLDQWNPLSTAAAARRLQMDANQSWGATWNMHVAPPADTSGFSSDPIMRPLFEPQQQQLPFRPPPMPYLPFEMPAPSTFMPSQHPSMFLHQQQAGMMRPPIAELPNTGTSSPFDQAIPSDAMTIGSMTNLSLTDRQYNWQQQQRAEHFMAGQIPAYFTPQQQQQQTLDEMVQTGQRGVEDTSTQSADALRRVPQQSRLLRYVAAGNTGSPSSAPMQMPSRAAFDPAAVVAGPRSALAQLRDTESPVVSAVDTSSGGGDAASVSVAGSGAKARAMTLPTITLNPNAPIFSVASAAGPDEARQSDRVTSSPSASAFDVEIGFRPPTQSPQSNSTPGTRRPRQH